jgi:formate hydrogenlyase subunit 3/multisubunit Na+/H+ antiporter MnhD subunit
LFNPYVKAIIATAVAFFGSLAASFDDSVLTTTEYLTAVGVGATALMAVWAFSKTVKWVVAGLVTGLGSLGLALQDDRLSYQEVITVVLAVLTALGAVYVTKNTAATKYATEEKL